MCHCVPWQKLFTCQSQSVSVTLKVKRPNTCTNLKKTANPQFVSKWWESERSAGVLCHAVSLCEGSLTCWMTSSTLYNLQQSPSKVLLFCWFSGFFVPVLIFYYIHYILYSMFQVYFLILWLSLLTCYMWLYNDAISAVQLSRGHKSCVMVGIPMTMSYRDIPRKLMCTLRKIVEHGNAIWWHLISRLICEALLYDTEGRLIKRNFILK